MLGYWVHRITELFTSTSKSNRCVKCSSSRVKSKDTELFFTGKKGVLRHLPSNFQRKSFQMIWLLSLRLQTCQVSCVDAALTGTSASHAQVCLPQHAQQCRAVFQDPTSKQAEVRNPKQQQIGQASICAWLLNASSQWGWRMYYDLFQSILLCRKPKWKKVLLQQDRLFPPSHSGHASASLRKGSGWLSGRGSSPEGGGQGIGSPGHWTWPQASRGQEASGQHSHIQSDCWVAFCGARNWIW